MKKSTTSFLIALISTLGVSSVSASAAHAMDTPKDFKPNMAQKWVPDAVHLVFAGENSISSEDEAWIRRFDSKYLDGAPLTCVAGTPKIRFDYSFGTITDRKVLGFLSTIENRNDGIYAYDILIYERDRGGFIMSQGSIELDLPSNLTEQNTMLFDGVFCVPSNAPKTLIFGGKQVVLDSASLKSSGRAILEVGKK
jgi:hypothetical protein